MKKETTRDVFFEGKEEAGIYFSGKKGEEGKTRKRIWFLTIPVGREELDSQTDLTLVVINLEMEDDSLVPGITSITLYPLVVHRNDVIAVDVALVASYAMIN